jgi:DhnA family fructose-bisphosphate aldolase class Ia
MKRRMHHLLRADGRILIVAMDHAGFSDRPLPGLVKPGELIHKVVSAGADAILTTLGTATTFTNELGGGGLILTVNSDEPMLQAAVETALVAGADAVKCMLYPGLAGDRTSIVNASRLGAECKRWQMPFLAEVVPGGFQGGPEFRTPEKIAGGARVGAEVGGDLIKTLYTGSADTFRMVTENCYVPVVILGGAKMDSDEDLLNVVKGSLDGGGAGVAFGNNIWRHEHPDRLVAAIVAVMHDGATVAQALKKLRG